MDLLSQLYTQLANHIRSMTPGSRTVAGLLLAVVAMGLGCLCVWPSADSGKLTAADRASSPARALRQAESDDPMEAAIGRDSLLLLANQREALYKNAEEKALARKITGYFPDVATAEVTLNRRMEPRAGRPRTVPTATACIKMKRGVKLDRKTGMMIRDYVAAAAGRDPAEVSVFDPSHHTSFQGGESDASDELAARQAIEQECQEKIRCLLNTIPGVTVVVSVQPDQTEDRPALARPSIAPPEHVATIANQPRQLPAAPADLPATDRRRKPAAARVRVVIRVPSSHFEKLWRDQGPAARRLSSKRPSLAELRAVESEEIARIKRLAAGVLPASGWGDELAGAVTVVSFPDGSSPPASQEADESRRPFRAAEYGSVLAMIVLAVAMPLVVRTFVRRKRPGVVEQKPTKTPSAPAEPLAAALGRRDDPAGIELDGELARRLIERHQAQSESPACVPFGLLRKTDFRRIARILEGELPQTIALVLAHLPPRQAGRVLVSLAPAAQADVLRCLVDLEQANPETLREIERSLASRLAEQVPMQPRRVAGLKAVNGILEAARGQIGRQILDNLAAHDESLAAEFESCVAPDADRPSLEDLAQCDLGGRAALCEAAGEELLALALVGAPPEIADRLLAGLPHARAAAIRRSLDRPQPTRLSDVDAAKEELIELAATLAAAGRLVLPERMEQASLLL